MLLKPSPAGVALTGLAHAAAAAAALLALPALPAVLCITGIAMSMIAAGGRLLLRSRWSVLGLELHADGTAAWLARDGRWRPAARAAGVALAPWLIALAVEMDGERGTVRTLLVLPDAAEAEGRRRLRAWLRWRPAGATRPDRGESRAAVVQDGGKPFERLN
ncbi:MAG: hypothetical protein M5U08_11515 [Burkholderiales bacterium]|nr:hypothetical protein [Burkholderiales bacterium]